MKRELRNRLIVLLLAILSLFALGGCSLSEGLDDFLASNGLDARVTYYANGGLFEDNSVEKNMYYTSGSKALNIGVNKNDRNISVKRDDYEFVGWYYVTEVIDEAKGLWELGEEVDFSASLQENDHWKIAAKWQKSVGVQVVMACPDGATVEVGENINAADGVTSFVNGSVIGELYYDSKDQLSELSADPTKKLFTVKDKAYTFFGYYMDEECETSVTWPLVREEEQTTIYAKYIEGDWNFVKNADDVFEMFESGLESGKNYWLRNDIDYQNDTVNMIGNFNGVLKGNGYKISNIKVNKTLSQGNKVALFGNIGETAKLENVTFENVTVECTMKTASHAEVYFVFLSKHADAVVENVSISGSLKVKGATGFVIDNMTDGTGAARYDNCLFGGYATDAEYADGGFRVDLTIDGKQITE